jgi:S1-C subfamily serine protease
VNGSEHGGIGADGPAAQAGLRAEDVITSINGAPATRNVQLQELTLSTKPGDTVAL